MTLKRIIAFTFDVISVFLIAMAISVSPLNPNYENTVSLQEDYLETTEEYREKFNSLDEEDEARQNVYDEYLDISKKYVYDYNRSVIYEEVITFVALILYFGVFAYAFDGETVGKRLVKLRVVDKDKKKPSLPMLIFRTFILFGMPFSILTIAFSYIYNVETYYEIYSVLYVLSIGFNIALIWTVVFKKDKRGIHDMLTKTKVIETKE